jgi:hypothetical protein
MQVAQVVDGVEYRANRGWFDMPDHHAAAHLRSAGFGRAWQIPGIPPSSSGFRCPECGHGSFFKRCKCGAECVRESSGGR